MQQVKRAPVIAKLQVERARARFGFVDIAVRTFRRYSDDDAASYAAALTYFAFFSIFPLLLFGAAVLGYVTFGNERLQKDILDAAVSSIPLVREALRPEGLDLIQENRQEIALTGFVLALYSGSGAVVALEHALNKVNHVTDEPGFVEKRLRSLKWLAVLGVGALLSVCMGAVAGLAPGILATVAAIAAGFCINVFIFATAYKYLPKTQSTWTDALPGAIVAAVAFELLKVFGGVYLSSGEGSRNKTFGALAGAATLLVASYLISQVVLLAGEVNAVIKERREFRGS